MVYSKHLLVVTLAIVFSVALNQSNAQGFILKGSVFDYYNRRPVEAVSVLSTGGGGSISDSLGHYQLKVNEKDSVWFSYGGKNTMKYPVDTISNPENFIIGLHIDVPWLPEVKIRGRNYNEDSVQNRKDYANIFNYKKPGLKLSTTPPSSYVPGSVTVGLDLDELINTFRFKRNRQLASFQNRLLQEERDKYVNHRFNKRIIKSLTDIQDTDIDEFINYYKPNYDELLLLNDLELGYYIQQCYAAYSSFKNRRPKAAP